MSTTAPRPSNAVATQSVSGLDARPVTSIVAVVPVHNEELLLRACLSALTAAADQAPVDVRIVVVLDACTDASAAITTQHARIDSRVTVVVVDEHCVGAARAAGCATIAAGHGVWIACTDADSTVPARWFAAIASAAVAGVDVVAGTVQITRWREHDAPTAARYTAAYATPEGSDHGHIHGANMAIRSTSYTALGGFRSLSTGEDVDLVHRSLTAGHRVHWLRTPPVTTSDRRHARAPEGFAAHLEAVAMTATASCAVVAEM